MTDPKLKAFLDLIAFSEGTATSPLTRNNGYDVIVTGIGGPEIFTDYSDHPFAKGRPAKVIRVTPPLTSTASGRYQLLLRYWRAYQNQLNLDDFSPDSQDAVALQQMRERGATGMVLAGNIPEAIEACATIWASFPGNEYGQGGKSMPELLEKYGEFEAAGRASGDCSGGRL